MQNDDGWSRDLLYQVVESVREYAIFATGTDGHIATWNPGSELIFGYAADEIIGKNAEILFTPEDRKNNVPQMELAVAARNGCASDERWHTRKDGSRFFAAGIQTALRDGRGELTGYVKIARDLTDRVSLEEKLQVAYEAAERRITDRTKDLSEQNQRLRVEVSDRRDAEELRTALLRRIVQAQESERKRISKDFHDHVGQQLTALKLKLRSIADRNQIFPELLGEITQIQEIANSIDQNVDFLAWELRPSVLDDVGLEPAVDKFVMEWSSHFKIPAEFRVVRWPDRRLISELEISLYRVMQEALNNTAKHAAASSVSVILEERDGLARLIVEDDGKGFEPSQVVPDHYEGRGLGILGMKERAELVGGSFEIESHPGSGTTVFVRVPARFAE
jgi:PAS domain S-box-containing protein